MARTMLLGGAGCAPHGNSVRIHCCDQAPITESKSTMPRATNARHEQWNPKVDADDEFFI